MSSSGKLPLLKLVPTLLGSSLSDTVDSSLLAQITFFPMSFKHIMAKTKKMCVSRENVQMTEKLSCRPMLYFFLINNGGLCISVEKVESLLLCNLCCCCLCERWIVQPCQWCLMYVLCSAGLFVVSDICGPGRPQQEQANPLLPAAQRVSLPCESTWDLWDNLQCAII